jgi:hypothetical protein
MQHRKYLSAPLLWGVFLNFIGCQAEPSGEADAVGRTVAAIVTPAALELTISGHLRVGDGPTESTELDFHTLQLALMERCMEEIKEQRRDDGGYYYDECDLYEEHRMWGAGSGLDGKIYTSSDWTRTWYDADINNDRLCDANLCAGRLFSCLGLKNQQLAETLVPVEISAYPFAPLVNDIIDEAQAFRLFIDRKTRRISSLVDSVEGPQGSHQTFHHLVSTRWERAEDVYEYFVPPQSAPNATLLWRAATHAFREAVIRYVLAADRPGCDSEERREREAVGLTDSLNLLGQAAEMTSAYERSVADTNRRRDGGGNPY